jgi:hypothetical protein
MRKFALGIFLVLIVLSASCSCAAEKGATSRLESQQEKVFTKYMAYVSQDPKLDAAAKADETKLLQSLRDIVAALKRSLGE